MNHTTVVEFVLLGLANSRQWEIILFVFLGIAYLFILLGNISVISITLTNNFLQTPMYYFLRNFALLEITFTSTFLPSTLYIRPAQRGGQDSDKVLSLFFSVLTQTVNPYIYSLRNRQVKQALKEKILKFSGSLRQM
ncbi:hypothetical protein EK904_001390 [Melospiza melodia maxima]|nr:hypothetical protein EK904_001390 [Melospiza melodia maxima]